MNRIDSILISLEHAMRIVDDTDSLTQCKT